MTPKERAAMQQALEALEFAGGYCNGHGRSFRQSAASVEAITALREALAEPQITTPDVCGEVCARAKLCYGCNKDLEDANAKYAEQAEREPVAWCWMLGECAHIVWGSRRPDDAIHTTPLYAAPVRTKDLTDDEIWKELVAIQASSLKRSWLTFARAVIAADREKNK